MAKIVLSYRREDSRTITSWLYEKLVERYGKESVFRDIDSIMPTENFRKRIGRALRDADFVVAIVGPGWQGPNPDGPPRIQSTNDWVRVEIETVLQLDIPLLPVLVEDAQMPQPEDLPASLREMTEINALPISSEGSRFYEDLERLFRTIDTITGAEEASDEVEAAAPSTVPEESPHPMPKAPPLAPYTAPPAEAAPVARVAPSEPAVPAGSAMPVGRAAAPAEHAAEGSSAAAAGAPRFGGLSDASTIGYFVVLPAVAMAVYWTSLFFSDAFNGDSKIVHFLISAAAVIVLGWTIRRGSTMNVGEAAVAGAAVGLATTFTAFAFGQVNVAVEGWTVFAIFVGGGIAGTLAGYGLGALLGGRGGGVAAG